MKIAQTELAGLIVIDAPAFHDDRGYFMELWNEERYAACGIREVFRQDSFSESRKGVLRGLHAQNPWPQGKLVTCVAGAIWDVAVDLRVDSPTFGRWHAETLSAENHRQLWIPVGFAHGFATLSDVARVCYKSTEVYRPDAELSVVWNDPEVGVRWPVESPLLSPRDGRASKLRDLPRERLFRMASTAKGS